eukprot:6190551-Karenia_brevis.AAC.1
MPLNGPRINISCPVSSIASLAVLDLALDDVDLGGDLDNRCCGATGNLVMSGDADTDRRRR